MKVLLVSGLGAVLILAFGVFVWAMALLFAQRDKKEDSPQEPWEEPIQKLMSLQGGSIQPSHLAGMTNAIASAVTSLSRKLEASNQSTERLARVNLLLVCIIAVGTVAYTIAAWLQIR